MIILCGGEEPMCSLLEKSFFANCCMVVEAWGCCFDLFPTFSFSISQKIFQLYKPMHFSHGHGLRGLLIYRLIWSTAQRL